MDKNFLIAFDRYLSPDKMRPNGCRKPSIDNIWRYLSWRPKAYGGVEFGKSVERKAD